MPAVVSFSESRSLMPDAQTIGRLARPLSTNGAGWASVIVTVPAASSAFAFAPTGRKVPR